MGWPHLPAWQDLLLWDMPCKNRSSPSNLRTCPFHRFTDGTIESCTFRNWNWCELDHSRRIACQRVRLWLLACTTSIVPLLLPLPLLLVSPWLILDCLPMEWKSRTRFYSTIIVPRSNCDYYIQLLPVAHLGERRCEENLFLCRVLHNGINQNQPLFSFSCEEGVDALFFGGGCNWDRKWRRILGSTHFGINEKLAQFLFGISSDRDQILCREYMPYVHEIWMDDHWDSIDGNSCQVALQVHALSHIQHSTPKAQ